MNFIDAAFAYANLHPVWAFNWAAGTVLALILLLEWAGEVRRKDREYRAGMLREREAAEAGARRYREQNTPPADPEARALWGGRVKRPNRHSTGRSGARRLKRMWVRGHPSRVSLRNGSNSSGRDSTHDRTAI
jgi:hypothetical protein